MDEDTSAYHFLLQTFRDWSAGRYSFCSCTLRGVFNIGTSILTSLIQLIPTAFASLSDPCLPSLLIDDYPAMPGVIMMFALFCLFTIEMWLKAKTGGHSHGGPMGSGTVSLATQGARPGVKTAQSSQSLPPYGHSRDPSSYDFEKPHAYTQ